MIFTLNNVDTIANNFLAELRDKDIQANRPRFRRNLERLGEILAYEVSKSFDYSFETVNTPLGFAQVARPTSKVVVVPILRAAIPLFNGFMNVLDDAESGFVGAYRVENDEVEEVSVNLDYVASPSLDGKTMVLIDPMLATGKSMVKTLRALLKYGQPVKYHLVSVIAAPEGVQYVQQELKEFDTNLWVGALDEKLNERAYIVPGLGDAGDLSYGLKL